MYLLLKTFANADLEDAAVTRCAVVDVDPESIDWWLGVMDQAQQMSDKLRKTVTLTFMDYTPNCYQCLPEPEDHPELGEDTDEALEGGYCLLADHPFPENEDDAREAFNAESGEELPDDIFQWLEGYADFGPNPAYESANSIAGAWNFYLWQQDHFHPLRLALQASIY